MSKLKQHYDCTSIYSLFWEAAYASINKLASKKPTIFLHDPNLMLCLLQMKWIRNHHIALFHITATQTPLGKIDENGILQLNSNLSPIRRHSAEVAILGFRNLQLWEHASNFAKVAGYCCFCNQKLTNPDHLQRGYGDICGRRWNLPVIEHHDEPQQRSLAL